MKRLKIQPQKVGSLRLDQTDFRQMLFPFAGVTAEVDITDFAARRQGRPFFLSFLYAVVRAANAVPQLPAPITATRISILSLGRNSPRAELRGILIRSDSPRFVEMPTGHFQSLRNSLGQNTPYLR